MAAVYNETGQNRRSILSNYSFPVRIRRWGKYLINTIDERLHGLDFSMVYVGDIQRSQAEIHGYSMTDAQDMKRILQAIPVKASESAFLDIGCGVSESGRTGFR